MATLSHRFENVPLLLVTGQGRSGTTVLTKAIAEHPDIYSNRVESNVMKDVLLAGRSSSTVPSRVRQMVLSREEHDLVFRRMLLSLLFPADGWQAQNLPGSLSTFSAMNPEAAEFALTVFPGLHFANIVRNGVEVVASRMVHRVLGQHSFHEHCLAWAAAAEMVRWGQSRDDFTLIRHEALLEQESCRSTFAQLFERCRLPDSPASSDYVSGNRFNQTSYESEGGSDQDRLTTRQQRWNHWTADQRKQFVDLCGEGMEFFGYSLPEMAS